MVLLSDFFDQEKVEEITKIEGPNITNYELRIVWKTLMVQLNVTVKSFGIAKFSFSVPNSKGVDRLIFKQEMIPVFDRLLSKNLMC